MIGVIGGGQLGRMLALAGYPLGQLFRFLDPSPEAPAGDLAELIVGAYADPNALERLANGAQVVTYEFENVPVDAAKLIATRVPVYPPPEALEMAQDRVVEKSFFELIGIATAPFRPVDDRASLAAALNEFAFPKLPSVLKTRRDGYDGKGQAVLRTPDDVERAWTRLGGSPLILEAFMPFTRELSMLAVRGATGETMFYPLVENHHGDGILRLSLGPAANVGEDLQHEAEAIATLLLDELNYVGVLAIELFEMDGHVIANEMAPRVHNSGHWTIEGAETSQFENHLRAILGLPLGSTATIGVSAMVNLIGTIPDPSAILEIPGAHLHIYGKEPRPDRKLGHVTVRADDVATLAARLEVMNRVLNA